MKTGRKILNLRRDRGVAQKVPRRDDLSHSQCALQNRSENSPAQGPVALRIARVLGVSADYILDESAPYPPPGSVDRNRGRQKLPGNRETESLRKKSGRCFQNHGPGQAAFSQLTESRNQDMGLLRRIVDEAGIE